MSRFTEKMYQNALTSTTGMVTGEPHAPVRHTWGEVHQKARRVAGGLAAVLSILVWCSILFAGRWIAYTQDG